MRSTVANAQAIGKAIVASGSQWTAPVSRQRRVFAGDHSYRSGTADLRFQDNSIQCRAKIECPARQICYGPNKSASTVAIEVTRGSFRFVTGSRGGGFGCGASWRGTETAYAVTNNKFRNQVRMKEASQLISITAVEGSHVRLSGTGYRSAEGVVSECSYIK
jgi:hypothetical protein